MSQTYFHWFYFGLHTHEGLPHTRKTRVVSACQKLLNKSYVSIREVAQTIGVLVFRLPAVQYGQPFYRNIEIDNQSGCGPRNLENGLSVNSDNFDATDLRFYSVVKLKLKPTGKTQW